MAGCYIVRVPGIVRVNFRDTPTLYRATYCIRVFIEKIGFKYVSFEFNQISLVYVMVYKKSLGVLLNFTNKKYNNTS